MPISSLPDSTLRAITSTLVLNDAVSVVKELVDNALDAKATAIAIEISANTLDIIQVKDNGTGIGVEDRQLVCKRGCTSKITTIEDLERLGGSSLGFRGEALASVADLSESVTLTTQVDGETAGSMLKYGTAGALMSCSSASHPVGSTVRIKDFLNSIPVRRQTSLRNASRTLSAIKKLLQTYAFARGTVRFSFKVLKGKNEKANWSYTPVDSVDKLRDIATRILGKDVAGQCEVRSASDEDDGGSDAEVDECSVVALLATMEQDPGVLNNTGHYVSIDGRPVTAARGTIKEVVKLYRHYVRNYTALIQELPASFDPLLVMHITCPRGSYDVNIEPAKDEVMFTNPERVMALAEMLFKDHFGEQPELSTAQILKDKGVGKPKTSSSFDLLLAKRPVAPIELVPRPPGISLGTSLLQQHHNLPESDEPSQAERENLNLTELSAADALTPQEDGSISATPPRIGSNMYGLDADDELHYPPAGSYDGDQCIEEVENDLSRNPWSLAKLNAPVRCPNNVNCFSTSTNAHSETTASPHSKGNRVYLTPQPSTYRQPLHLQPQLPSPATSPYSPEPFQNPGPPNRPWPARQRRGESPDSESDQEMIPNTPSTQDERIVGSLDSWIRPVITRTELPGFKRVSAIYDKDGRFQRAQENDLPEFPFSRNQPPLNITSHGHPQQAGSLGRPFRLPLPRSSAGAAIDRDDAPQVALPARSESQQTSCKPSQSQNPELDQIMDFEYRKKAAHAQQRKAFGKAQGRVMSIAKLAQLQQSASHISDDELGSINSPGHQEHVEDLGQTRAFTLFGNRFDESVASKNATTKSNPHRNRYRAAAQALKRSRPDTADAETNESGDSGTADISDDGHETPELTDDDPRAYLIRNQPQTGHADTGGLSRAGVKIRRTKTQRLPLESIPPDEVLHDIVTRVESKQEVYTNAIADKDNYSTTGKNDFMVWTSGMSEVLTWQGELTALIENLYRARVGDELIPPNLELDLRRVIKTHCDNIR